MKTFDITAEDLKKFVPRALQSNDKQTQADGRLVAAILRKMPKPKKP